MGSIICLHRMPRARFDEATRRLRAVVALQDPAAIGRLIEESHEGEFREHLLELWRDDGETYGCREHVLNSCFTALATERVFDLDKSAPALEKVLGIFQQTRPLLQLLRPEGLDVELPEVALPDDSGLFGAWSSTALASCLGPATRFASRDAVEALLREDRGFLSRLLGPDPSRRREAVAAWSSEELWGHWATLAEAVRTTGANDYLGWFLSA